MSSFQNQGAITIHELIRLHTALVKCGFKLDDRLGQYVVQHFGEMLALLTTRERDLILTLLDDFLHCGWMECFPLLLRVFEAIPPAFTIPASTVILLPLVETKRNGRPKSASALLYPVENQVFPYVPSFSGKTIRVFEKMDLLSEAAHGRTDALIILLDDFIGSGGTAVKAVRRYRQLFVKDSDQLIVASVVAQRQGIEELRKEGVPTFAAVERQKGISESDTIGDRNAALALMDSLEKRLGVANDYLRGYAQCEALVSMMRTPNNTFPIFWHRTTATGEEWPAPFRRFA